MEEQLSFVQTLPSSQLTTEPTHCPALHLSLEVQALPSLQLRLLAGLAQPVSGAQLSVVQTLPSSQLAAGPAVQAPPEHLSPLVQALPSSQLAVVLVLLHPLVFEQVSDVHGLPSLQFLAVPAPQAPPAHLSLSVHASPSLHPAAFGWYTQPLVGAQESSVQGLLSLQITALPGVHWLATQVFPVVHLLLSGQGSVLAACWQPAMASQASVVHGFWSLQFIGGPAAQLPSLQVSPIEQTLPSLHSKPSAGGNTQPDTGSHASVVQALPSVQGTVGPAAHK